MPARRWSVAVGGQPPDQRAGRRDFHAAVPAPCQGLTLTDEGEMLYGAVTDVLSRLAAAEEQLKNIHDSPRGSPRSPPPRIGAYWLLPRLKEFLKEFPEVEIHLLMDDTNWICRSARPIWRSGCARRCRPI